MPSVVRHEMLFVTMLGSPRGIALSVAAGLTGVVCIVEVVHAAHYLLTPNCNDWPPDTYGICDAPARSRYVFPLLFGTLGLLAAVVAVVRGNRWALLGWWIAMLAIPFADAVAAVVVYGLRIDLTGMFRDPLVLFPLLGLAVSCLPFLLPAERSGDDNLAR